MPYVYDHPHPAVTVDIVLLDTRGEIPRVLLVRRAGSPFRGQWALPGGFVEIDESLEDAARRELKEETGIEARSIEQLGAFGDPDRDPRERVISVAYYACCAEPGFDAVAGSDAADARWFELDALPPLAFDHADIVACARRRLETDPT